jgi:hypothetical protein
MPAGTKVMKVIVLLVVKQPSNTPPPTVVRDAGKKSSTPTGAIKYRIEIKVREEQPQKA